MKLRRFPRLQDGDLVVMTVDRGSVVDSYAAEPAYAEVAAAIGKANPHLTNKETAILLILDKGTQLRRVDEETMRRAGWVRASR